MGRVEEGVSGEIFVGYLLYYKYNVISFIGIVLFIFF